MNNARYARCLATSQREFAFWAEMLNTPTVKRTRAQRRHVQSRQKRGRLLALEVLTKINRQIRNAPIGIRDLDAQDQNARDLAALRDGRIFGEGAVEVRPDLVALPASAAEKLGVDYESTGETGVVEIRPEGVYELTAAELKERTT